MSTTEFLQDGEAKVGHTDDLRVVPHKLGTMHKALQHTKDAQQDNTNHSTHVAHVIGHPSNPS